MVLKNIHEKLLSGIQTMLIDTKMNGRLCNPRW